MANWIRRTRIQVDRLKYLAVVVWIVGPSTLAEDKNGVAPTAISRPSGPGSLEGLGDAFQPALNTGTAKHRVRFALPPGIAGFTPDLALQYDSGQGFGVAGIGWTLDVPSVRRQVDKGLPRYVDSPGEGELPDRFVGISGEELVPLRNGYFLPKVEGTFVRYRRIGDAWEAHTRSGITMQFGVSPAARVSDMTGQRVFRWCLDRQIDTHGNLIQFEYERPREDEREIYLSGIRYGPGPGPWQHAYAARLAYEDRPDPRTDYRSGFRVRSSRRLTRVEVLYDEALIRRYVLRYDAHPHWSLLSAVTQFGSDGVSSLPPITFEYATLAPADKPSVISAAGHVIRAINEPPVVMDNAKAELLDVNADALPDVVVTDAGHLAYLNRGVRVQPDQTRAIAWEGPVAIDAQESRTLSFELSEGHVHLADMTGDAVADLVVTFEGSVEYFGNTGRLGWLAGSPMSTAHVPPPAPFGPTGGAVRTADFDFDKRIDVIRSDAGAYSVWFNLDGGAFSDAMLTDGAFYNNAFVGFSDPGVHLADLNGDRLSDLVKVFSDRVVVFAGLGLGHFDQPLVMSIPDQTLDDAPGGNLERAGLNDVNGDGLADLVVERAQGSDLWFWLNLGDDRFAALRTITGLPATPNAATRFADLNGNGTTDIIYADSTAPGSRLQAVDLGELVAGTAFRNALISIDNGYGRRTAIEYRGSTDFHVDALIAGNPWTITLPVPTPLVSRVSSSIGLDLDGFPDEGPRGDVYITDYVYRDGFYDPLEKQFRGFAFVKQIDRGDERFGGDAAPTMITRYGFHTGAPDGADNDADSETDEAHAWGGREEEPLKGLELWREVASLPDDPSRDGEFADPTVVFSREEHLWEVRDAATSIAGTLPALFGNLYRTEDAFARDVRQPINVAVHRTIIERQIDPAAHKRVAQQLDLDALGNVRFVWDRGDLADPADDLYTGYEYGVNESGWIVDRVSRAFQRAGDANGPFVSDTRSYYDGPPFVGSPLGQIGGRGLLHRKEGLISDGAVPAMPQRSFLRGDPREFDGRVDLVRQEFDEFGNPAVILDPNATLAPNGRPDGSGHERRMEYDPLLHKFPVHETVVIGAGSPDLEVVASYHLGFGTPTEVTDFNGIATQFRYDSFGRLEAEIRPGDDLANPTRTWQYNLAAPVSSIVSVMYAGEGGSPAIVSSKYFDGLGRPLGAFEAGGPAMTGVTLYNPRGTARKVYQPYFGAPLDAQGKWMLPNSAQPATQNRYDATGRVVETITPPDAQNHTAIHRKDYLPLRVFEYDGEDTNATGPHFDTPKTLVYDGLDRLIEVHEIETLSQADSGTFITRYRYALPDLLAEIEDAKGNIKYMRYDGLGRKIFMDDCDRGRTVYAYDAAGNLIETIDAKTQQVQFTYDGANRLLSEDYLDDQTPLTRLRTPDVRFYYDLSSDEYPGLPHSRGQLAYVTDLTGTEFRGYNARGALETTVKRIEQLDGSHDDWTTVTLADNLDRIYQITYPEGGVVRQQYDARGLLSAIENFVSELTYAASAQRSVCEFANSVVTSYEYDPRLRMTRILTESKSQVLQDLNYTYDLADNITDIVDGRLLPASDPRSQTASFLMDNCYRLVRAVGDGYGTINYDYDRLGNMVTQSSPDIPDVDVNLGGMSSGGVAGTFNRVGRLPADPPGPHALTQVSNGQSQRVFDYDPNGNMILNNGDLYLFDFKDRLGRIDKPGRDIRYLYDWSNRRVIKRVDGEQTTYINRLSEIRDGATLNYVFAGSTRVAQVQGAIPPPSMIAQRLTLSEGWNLISFQVDPATTDPAPLLSDLNGNYIAVYGHDGAGFLEFKPASGGNTLTEMYANRGYWILMSEPAEWLVEGPLAAVNQSGMSAGLVGIPGMAATSASDLLARNASIGSIHVYLGDTIGWRSFRADAPEYLNTLHHVMPGQGYWITSEDALAVLPMEEAVAVYYHTDHLASSNVLSSAEGGLASEFYNYPFGRLRHAHHAADDFDPHYQFTDKEQDHESSLHYFEARFYDSAIGRFARVDPFRAGQFDLLSPQKLNLYSYSLNRPLVMIDPTGLEGFLSSAWETVKDKGGTVLSAGAGLAGAALATVEGSTTQAVTKAKTALDTVTKAPGGGIVAMAEASKATDVVEATTGTLGKVQGVSKVVGSVGVGVSLAQTAVAVWKRATGQTQHSGDIVGGVSDSTVGVIGLKGGPVGAALAGGYAVGSVIVAPAIDANTSWYDDVVKEANEVADVMRAGGASETETTIVGSVAAGLGSLGVSFEGLRDALSQPRDSDDPW
jgi:RHS repeat-associated protein